MSCSSPLFGQDRSVKSQEERSNPRKKKMGTDKQHMRTSRPKTDPVIVPARLPRRRHVDRVGARACRSVIIACPSVRFSGPKRLVEGSIRRRQMDHCLQKKKKTVCPHFFVTSRIFAARELHFRREGRFATALRATNMLSFLAFRRVDISFIG